MNPETAEVGGQIRSDGYKTSSVKPVNVPARVDGVNRPRAVGEKVADSVVEKPVGGIVGDETFPRDFHRAPARRQPEIAETVFADERNVVVAQVVLARVKTKIFAVKLYQAFPARAEKNSAVARAVNRAERAVGLRFDGLEDVSEPGAQLARIKRRFPSQLSLDAA
jgi:hypothetical protein